MASDDTTNGRGNVTLSVSNPPSSSSQLLFLNDQVQFNVWTPVQISINLTDKQISQVDGWQQNCSLGMSEKYQTSRLEVTAIISDGSTSFEADILQIVGDLVSYLNQSMTYRYGVT